MSPRASDLDDPLFNTPSSFEPPRSPLVAFQFSIMVGLTSFTLDVRLFFHFSNCLRLGTSFSPPPPMAITSPVLLSSSYSARYGFAGLCNLFRVPSNLYLFPSSSPFPSCMLFCEAISPPHCPFFKSSPPSLSVCVFASSY